MSYCIWFDYWEPKPHPQYISKVFLQLDFWQAASVMTVMKDSHERQPWKTARKDSQNVHTYCMRDSSCVSQQHLG